mmetsp:Transcript_24710/g.57549  ORF Transcript_24710/g.57549 Transcript_24710/m.57549 type:complete len:261 (+) Transcript_24710:1368-2150(+)
MTLRVEEGSSVLGRVQNHLGARKRHFGVELINDGTNGVEAGGVARPPCVVLVLIEDGHEVPAIVESATVPMAAAIMVPSFGVVFDETSDITSHIGTALVHERRAAVVRIKRVVLPRVRVEGPRGHGVRVLVDPRGHRRGVRRHRVRARALLRVLPAHGRHEVSHDAIEERRVPVGCWPVCGAVRWRELSDDDKRVWEPRREAHELRAEVGEGVVVGRKGPPLCRSRQKGHDVDLHGSGGVGDAHRRGGPVDSGVDDEHRH